ncbi:MAG: glutamine--fructose-6-phosphate transaminase (isomerizing) [Acidobacteriota bacterium]
MCGIVGMVGREDVVAEVVAGLQALEYRGYDSAGVAVVESGEEIRRVRAAGKLKRLVQELQQQPLSGTCAIGHTRWATHGRPTDDNAHPHVSSSGEVALVHNGIIENFLELRERLAKAGHEIRTDTDTEVLAHLIEHHLERAGHGGKGSSLLEAVQAALKEVVGVHSLAVVSRSEPDTIVASTNGPPNLIGIGDDGLRMVASDLAPIVRHARRVHFLEEGETALVRGEDVEIHGSNGRVEREPRVVDMNPVQAEKGGYKHFMLKEMHEQPRVLEEVLVGRLQPGTGEVNLDDTGLPHEILENCERVLVLACGTSLHAGMVARHLIERLAGIPCQVEIASEFRYAEPVVPKNTLALAITQSGETADTIAAMREAAERGAKLLVNCNVLGSAATRIADGTLHMRAGLEIGVASTKCFTAELACLTLLAMKLGQVHGRLSAERSAELAEGLRSLPRLVEEVLSHGDAIDAIARDTMKADNYLFLGRGLLHPIALEGALKLKEISYIHAEGYAAGEMKHGPIALIDENMPIVGLCLESPTRDKVMANLQEAKAREGRLLAVVTEGDERLTEFADHVIELPPVDEMLAPVVASIPLQFLAYHVGVRRGCDVDQPRNLAKSVTVE